jgi:hypothetical protein
MKLVRNGPHRCYIAFDDPDGRRRELALHTSRFGGNVFNSCSGREVPLLFAKDRGAMLWTPDERFAELADYVRDQYRRMRKAERKRRDAGQAMAAQI